MTSTMTEKPSVFTGYSYVFNQTNAREKKEVPATVSGQAMETAKANLLQSIAQNEIAFCNRQLLPIAKLEVI